MDKTYKLEIWPMYILNWDDVRPFKSGKTWVLITPNNANSTLRYAREVK